MTNLDTIRSKLTEDELFCQLAEEAAELSHATLKLRRARNGVNPTPVTVVQAYADMLEEIADVTLCLRTLGFEWSMTSVQSIIDKKAARWVKRLKQGVCQNDS